MHRDNTPIAVSVLVATYNRQAYLDQSLSSIVGQSRAPDEVIVVDDGSTDATAQVVTRYAHRGVRYFREKNKGKAAALNFAMTQLRGNHVCFFDDDDILLPDALQNHVDVLSNDPNADYTYSSNLIYDDHGGQGTISNKSRWRAVGHCQESTPDALFLRTLEWGEYFLTYLQGMVLPVRCLREIGLFNEALAQCEDYDMMLRLARRFRGVSVGRATFVMRNHSGLRGSAREQHTESDRYRVWHEYNEKIVLPYRESLPLAAYLENKQARTSTQALSPNERFHALVQRSKIMFSHGFFQEGAKDVEIILSELRLESTQLDILAITVRQAADIQQKHLVAKAPAFAKALGISTKGKPEKNRLLVSALKGTYWALARSYKKREWRNVIVFTRTAMIINCYYLMGLHARPGIAKNRF